MALACLLPLACTRPSSRPDVVLIVLDTVRADRVSCYGYERVTTPRIDELCRRGLRFDRASSASSWTVPSHASLFSGLYPIDHGATQESPRLGPAIPSLPEILAGYGYATFGVSANPLVSHVTGLDRGFEKFEITASRPRGGEHPNVAAVREQLAARRGRPLFLFVNFIEAHHPYDPPEPERSRFLATENAELLDAALALTPDRFYLDPGPAQPQLRVLSDLYDGELATLDRAVGELLQVLAEEGVLDDALLILTSDHGEAFGEHGTVRHAFDLHAPLVRVPLIVVPPDGDGGVVRSEPVSGVDVFTTILEAAGVASVASDYPGRSLMADPEPRGRATFSEYYYPVQAFRILDPALGDRRDEVLARFGRRLRSVERDGLRLIASTPGSVELFDVREDPGERRNLADDPSRSAERAQLEALLGDFIASRGSPRPLPEPSGSAGFGELEASLESRLRELGYVR